MSKMRTVARYSTAGAVTVLYAAAAREALRDKQPIVPFNSQRVAIAAGTLTALTWLVAVL